MVFVGGEIHQDAIELKGGHAITNGLFSVRRRLLDNTSQLPKRVLNVLWKRRNIVVDIVELGC